MPESDNQVVIFDVPYICPRTGNGIVVRGYATVQQIEYAAILVVDCENQSKQQGLGPCPEDCSLQSLVSSELLDKHRDLFGEK